MIIALLCLVIEAGALRALTARRSPALCYQSDILRLNWPDRHPPELVEVADY
jgi:hypothetical protein